MYIVCCCRESSTDYKINTLPTCLLYWLSIFLFQDGLKKFGLNNLVILRHWLHKSMNLSDYKSYFLLIKGLSHLQYDMNPESFLSNFWGSCQYLIWFPIFFLFRMSLNRQHTGHISYDWLLLGVRFCFLCHRRYKEYYLWLSIRRKIGVKSLWFEGCPIDEYLNLPWTTCFYTDNIHTLRT